jgi:hypothetical protein
MQKSLCPIIIVWINVTSLRFEFRSVVSKDGGKVTERNDAAIRTKLPKNDSCFFLT